MEVGWKFGIYIGVASGTGIILLLAIFIYLRYYHNKEAQKKPVANGIIGQLKLSRDIPDFTIPLMMPMFIQSKLASDGEVFDAVKEAWSLGSNSPMLVQPEESYDNPDDEETGTGPVIRRLESVMDVSMFPDQENNENRQEATGPWTSSRRESLFFPYLCEERSSSRGAAGSTGGDSVPLSPSKLERRYTERGRTYSTSSDADQKGSIRPRISSDATSIKRKTTKPLLVKKISCPETSPSLKLPLMKRFGSIYRRQVSSDSLLGGVKSYNELPASKRGNLVLTMRQNVDEKKLIVHLVNATDLPMKNNNLLDTFARLYLIMASKQHRQQSKVLKKTCNPIYDETFVFDDIENSELLQSRLRIKILQKDGFSRGDMVGELSIDLSEENMLNGAMIERNLLPRATNATEDGSGELLVSVCHHAITAQLKVLIMKMRDLPKSAKNPSVSVELVYQDELLQRQQTRSKKQRKKLVFNEEMIFHVTTSSSNPLENYSLQFSIFSQDMLKGAVCIGYVTLGLDAPRESEIEHWKAVVSSPHKPVTAMHKFHRTPV